MKNQDSKKNRTKQQQQQQEKQQKQQHETDCKIEGQSTDTNNAEQLKAEKSAKKKAIADAIKANLEAVEKSDT